MGGVVAGVRVATRDSGDAVASASASLPPAESGSLQATAEQFASAWTSDNIDRMWALLSPDAQLRYPRSEFGDEYNAFSVEMTETRVGAKVTSLTGSTARLSARLETAYFGVFEYTTTLNLFKVNGAWLIDWDRPAIHPELTDGRAFKSTIERARRGSILDRNGNPLAVTKDVRLLGLNRSVITNRDNLKAALVNFGFTADQVDKAYASTAGQNQRVAVGAIPDAKAEAATTTLRGIPGVLLYFEAQRVHPLGAAAAHVVGYTRELTAEELATKKGTGVRIGDRAGAAGLEAALETRLAGQHGAELRLVEADGVTSARTVQSRALVQGENVTTTLDANVLATTQARLGTRAGAAVVMDPRTNAILALNSSPSFDPDAFERNDRAALAALADATGGPQANRATHGLYSAGSTFKLITGSAGLVYGGFKTTDQIYCGSSWDGDGEIKPARRNWEGAQGLLTIAEGLMRSCNPVFYTIGLQLYKKTDGGLSKMARQFGLGAASGVVGLTEEDGLVPDAAWKLKKRGEQWFAGDEVNLAIGQGDLLITPLQLANAYSTFIAGDLRVPVLIAGETATSRGKLPLEAAQTALLRQGLKLVTTVRGTARAAFADAGYFDFGGKSGTAEDLGALQHVLFVAFSPADVPKAVAAVVLDEGQSGSIEAGPIARDIVLAALR